MMLNLLKITLVLSCCFLVVTLANSHPCYENEPPQKCLDAYNESINASISAHQPSQKCSFCCIVVALKDCVESHCGQSYNMEWNLTLPLYCTDLWMYNSSYAPMCLSTGMWAFLGSICVIILLFIVLVVKRIMDKRSESRGVYRPAAAAAAAAAVQPEPAPCPPLRMKKVNRPRPSTPEQVAVDIPVREPQPGPSRLCTSGFSTPAVQNNSEPMPYRGIQQIQDDSTIPMIDDTDEDETETPV